MATVFFELNGQPRCIKGPDGAMALPEVLSVARRTPAMQRNAGRCKHFAPG